MQRLHTSSSLKLSSQCPTFPRATVQAKAVKGFGSSASKPKKKAGKRKLTYLDLEESEEAESACPCGSGQTYESCCERFISGKEEPQTAEELMRSRYSAYSKKQVDWILDTTHPNNQDFEERERSAFEREIRNIADNSRFCKLQVLDTEAGRNDREAYVEFRMWVKNVGKGASEKKIERAPTKTFTESSRFKKKDGRWLYIEAVNFSEKSYPMPES